MWGICLDPSLCEGKLFQRVIEYQLKEKNKAITAQPISNVEVDIQNIKMIVSPPKYQYGDLVSLADHMDRKGNIRDIVWHSRNHTFNYYIEVENKMVSKRYYEEDFI